MDVTLSRRTSDDTKPKEAVWNDFGFTTNDTPTIVQAQKLIRLVFNGVPVKRGDYVNTVDGNRYCVWKLDEFELGTAAWCIELIV